jgi:uncharacterized protein (TIGR00299 family) protein
MRIAYFDAPSGISGDMTVGALLDAGGARLGIERLRAALSSLPVEGYEIALERVQVEGVGAASFRVLIEQHGHQHSHGHRHAGHEHRDWRTIRAMIEHARGDGLSAGAVERALAIFAELAVAEGRVHGVSPDDVHFHEVGAVDSIVDIVATAWCLDELGVDACFVGPLPSGSGTVMSEHGLLPVPAPATVELLRGFEVVAGDGEGELVTPTGAAILRALAKPLRPVFRLHCAGAGAGMRRLRDRPNVLRVLIGECDAHDDEQLAVIEADIDDMTPAALAHAAERLRQTRARDVSLAPIVMKKGRPAMRLTVLCDVADVRPVAAAMLSETTTIGLRYRTCARVVLARRIEIADTELGPIALKIVQRPSGEETAEPELDDVARAAVKHERPLGEVRAAALAAWKRR